MESKSAAIIADLSYLKIHVCKFSSQALDCILVIHVQHTHFFSPCSPDLERLRGDGDQWTAAQKVASSPITILSGKGGCGKTTVVTQIIRHVCLQSVLQKSLL